MNILYDSYSSIGGRKVNEDSFLAVNNNETFLFAVADGLGGEGNGDIASQIAIRELKNSFTHDKVSLQDSITWANLKILNKQKEMHKKMKSTCASVLVERDKTTIANVGDSRTYLFFNDRIVYQSKDHSVSQVAVALGEITPDQIREYEDRSILTRTLGVSDELKIDIDIFDNKKFESILICSDGFWEFVTEEEMLDTLRSSEMPQEWLNKMRQIHDEKAPSDCDNNTAIAVLIK